MLIKSLRNSLQTKSLYLDPLVKIMSKHQKNIYNYSHRTCSTNSVKIGFLTNEKSYSINDHLNLEVS